MPAICKILSKEPPSALIKRRMTVSGVSTRLREKSLPLMLCVAALSAALSAMLSKSIDMRIASK